MTVLSDRERELYMDGFLERLEAARKVMANTHTKLHEDLEFITRPDLIEALTLMETLMAQCIADIQVNRAFEEISKEASDADQPTD